MKKEAQREGHRKTKVSVFQKHWFGLCVWPCCFICSHGIVQQGVTWVSHRRTLGRNKPRKGYTLFLFIYFYAAGLASSNNQHHIFISLQLHLLEDITKFTLWRNVSTEKQRMLQERIWQPGSITSRVSAEITGYKDQRSRSVRNRFPNLKSRSAVCCHESAALFTQTYRLFQVAEAKAFSAAKNNHCKLSNSCLTSCAMCVPRSQSWGNMWVWANKRLPVVAPFSLGNQVAWVISVCSTAEQCRIQVLSAAASWSGCMHRQAFIGQFLLPTVAWQCLR